MNPSQSFEPRNPADGYLSRWFLASLDLLTRRAGLWAVVSFAPIALLFAFQLRMIPAIVLAFVSTRSPKLNDVLHSVLTAQLSAKISRANIDRSLDSIVSELEERFGKQPAGDASKALEANL